MQARRSRLVRLGVLALTLCLSIGMTAGVAEAQKKKKKMFCNKTQTVGAPIPDRAPGPGGLFGQFNSFITCGGKAVKKAQVRDVNVVIHAVGATGTTPISDLRFQLTAPNGSSTYLWVNNSAPPGQSNLLLGPLTVDDESRLNLGSGNPVDPTALFAPWGGGARPDGKPLSVMDNTPLRGHWELLVQDTSAGETSVLTSWSLNIAGGRKYLTK